MGEQVRINTQLIDAETGAHIWADRFDGARRDLPELQNEVTGRLARTLNRELIAAAGRRIEQEHRADPDAQDWAMRGWALFHRPPSRENRQAARGFFERALEIDGRSSDAMTGLAQTLADDIAVGWSTSPDEDKARAEPLIQQALDLDPNFINAFWWQGMSYAGKRDFPKSIAGLTRAVGMNDGPLFRALLGHVYGRAGDRAKALGMLEEVTTLARERYVSPVDFAVIYAGLGDADSTFLWLEKAYQSRATRVGELGSMYFDGLRSDPRYADLMRRVGLPLSPR